MSIASDEQLRWVGPEKGVIHLATAAVVNAVWDLYAKVEGKPLWKLLVDMSPEQLVACIPFRYIARCPDAGRGARDPAPERTDEGGPRSRDASDRLSGLHDLVAAGWATRTRRSGACAARVSPPAGHHFKLKVGRDLAGRQAPAGDRPRGDRPDRVLMVDANQVWDVDQAIAWMRELAAYRPWWIEEPTSPDDVLGHARIARALEPLGIGVATGEHVQNRVVFKQLFQADAIALLPDRQLPARRRERDPRRPADGRQVRRAGLSARRRRRAVRVRAAPGDLRLHRGQCIPRGSDRRVRRPPPRALPGDPVVIRDGRYLAPLAPGYSIEMKPAIAGRLSIPRWGRLGRAHVARRGLGVGVRADRGLRCCPGRPDRPRR